MSDLISRQEALDALGERPLVWDEWADEYSLGQRNQYDADKSAIEALSPAQPEQECEKCIFKPFKQFQPERKTGKWIYGEDEYGIDGYHCDKCGFFVLWDYAHNFINYIEDYNFCPNCGAEMEVSDGSD